MHRSVAYLPCLTLVAVRLRVQNNVLNVCVVRYILRSGAECFSQRGKQTETTTGESEEPHFAKLTENKGWRVQTLLNAKDLNARLRIVGSRFQVFNLLWTWS